MIREKKGIYYKMEGKFRLEPTGNFRYVERLLFPEQPTHKHIIKVLQQEWFIGLGKYKWVDVPVEDEK